MLNGGGRAVMGRKRTGPGGVSGHMHVFGVDPGCDAGALRRDGLCWNTSRKTVYAGGTPGYGVDPDPVDGGGSAFTLRGMRCGGRPCGTTPPPPPRARSPRWPLMVARIRSGRGTRRVVTRSDPGHGGDDRRPSAAGPSAPRGGRRKPQGGYSGAGLDVLSDKPAPPVIPARLGVKWHPSSAAAEEGLLPLGAGRGGDGRNWDIENRRTQGRADGPWRAACCRGGLSTWTAQLGRNSGTRPLADAWAALEPGAGSSTAWTSAPPGAPLIGGQPGIAAGGPNVRRLPADLSGTQRDPWAGRSSAQLEFC